MRAQGMSRSLWAWQRHDTGRHGCWALRVFWVEPQHTLLCRTPAGQAARCTGSRTVSAGGAGKPGGLRRRSRSALQAA
jgi:hypothetical protein